MFGHRIVVVVFYTFLSYSSRINIRFMITPVRARTRQQSQVPFRVHHQISFPKIPIDPVIR